MSFCTLVHICTTVTPTICSDSASSIVRREDGCGWNSDSQETETEKCMVPDPTPVEMWKQGAAVAVCSALMATSQLGFDTEDGPSACPAPVSSCDGLQPRRALIVGGTGATGKRVVARLAADPRVSEVTAIVRREGVAFEVDHPKDVQKIKVVVVPDLLNMGDEASTAFQGQDVVFCTLGTTRKQAGSAANFVKVDRDMVDAVATVAAGSNVPHFSLLTSTGAMRIRMPTSVMNALHPFLYINTKWEAEQAVIAKEFPRVSIFQPGGLNRKAGKPSADTEANDPGRWLEKVAMKVMPMTKVDVLAAAMIKDALEAREVSEGPCVDYFSTSQIRSINVQDS